MCRSGMKLFSVDILVSGLPVEIKYIMFFFKRECSLFAANKKI